MIVKQIFIVGLVIIAIFILVSWAASRDDCAIQSSLGTSLGNAMMGKRPWAPNACPVTPTCPTCPCPDQKPCSPCATTIPGYDQYGPASISNSSASGAYTCQGSQTPGYCVLDAASAPAACSADPLCVGFLKVGTNDTTRMLVRSQPINSGPVTPTIFWEKNSNAPITQQPIKSVRFVANSGGGTFPDYIIFTSTSTFNNLNAGSLVTPLGISVNNAEVMKFLSENVIGKSIPIYNMPNQSEILFKFTGIRAFTGQSYNTSGSIAG